MFINEVGNKDQFFNLLTTELRKFNIKYRKDKKLKNIYDEKISNKKIFKTPLHFQELKDVTLDSGAIVQIPSFVNDACNFILENIDTEGLFRKAGSSARQKEIKIHLDSGRSFERNIHVIDIANILKSFFRDLPEPLLPPGNIQESLMRCLLCGDKKVEALLLTCLLLPPITLNTLSYFMQFLKIVALHSQRNKMSIENLAIIFTPSIMPPEEIIGKRLNNHVKILSLLIENAHRIGIVPEDLTKKSQGTLNYREGDEKNSRNLDEKPSKKKRRSGSLTRMFNGLKKIVGAFGSSEHLDKTPESNTFVSTPCLNKSAKKRKVNELQAFSAKKKKGVLMLQPEFGSLIPCTPLNTRELKKLCNSEQKTSKFDTKSKDFFAKLEKPMERRWSVVGTAFSSRKKSNDKSKSSSDLKKTLSTVTSMSSLNIDTTLISLDKSSSSVLGKGVNLSDNKEVVEPDYIKISKTQYEEIEERVSIIESRISQEFSNLISSKDAANENNDGIIHVQDEYKKTLEETETMNEFSSATNQLARRLSKELKIRNSTGQKIIRSPSARKIGTIRRRSREIKKRVSCDFPSTVTFEDKNKVIDRIIPDLVFYPKHNLKRGRPNTIQTGLRHPSPTKISNVSDQNDVFNLKNIDWKCADDYFKEQDDIEMFSTPTRPVRSSPRLASKPNLNNSSDILKTPHFVTKIIVGELQNSSENIKPVLPPRKTSEKTTHIIINKNIMTPLREQQTGRASIARIRSQNAGMVMAKAKLFDGMATNDIHFITNEINKETEKNNARLQNTPRRRGVVRKTQLKTIRNYKQTTRSPKHHTSNALKSNVSNESYSPVYSTDNIKTSSLFPNQVVNPKNSSGDETTNIKTPPKIKGSITSNKANSKIIFKTPSQDTKHLRKPIRATPNALKYSPRRK